MFKAPLHAFAVSANVKPGMKFNRNIGILNWNIDVSIFGLINRLTKFF